MSRIIMQRRRLSAALFVALGVMVAATVLQPQLGSAGTVDHQLRLSYAPDRSDATRLWGSTISQPAYIFVSNPVAVSEVAFFVDGKQVPNPVERIAPFDLAGTNKDGTARPLDVSTLGTGTHKVTAKVTKGTTIQWLGAKFEIVRAQPMIKPTISGLVNRSGAANNAYSTIADDYVVNAYWKDLQPQQNGAIAAGNAIDIAIADAEKKNAAGAKVGLKLRVFAGGHAPDWAKHLSGTPVTVYDNYDGKTAIVGRFWEPAFGRSYEDLHRKLAAKYDSSPVVLDVTIARCTTVYAEPFLRQIANADTRANFLAAGYTAEADMLCHDEAARAHDVWKRTRSSLAANPLQTIAPDGKGSSSATAALAQLQQCRDVLGNRCVIENNSIRESFLSMTGAYGELYNGMLKMGGPMAFQTATAQRVGDLAKVLDWTATNGATSVELPAGYPTMLTAEQMTEFDRRIEANAALVR